MAKSKKIRKRRQAEIRRKPASIGSIWINRAVIISAHDMQTQALEFD